MTPALPPLPIGISDFSEIRRQHLLYVDKTKQIDQLLDNKYLVFIARPHGMGRTLLLSTIKELYLHGDQNCEGLAVHGNCHIKEPRKVITLSFKGAPSSSPAALETWLKDELVAAFCAAGYPEAKHIKRYEIFWLYFGLERIIKDDYPVFLVDDWDYPLTCQRGNETLFKRLHAVVQHFYNWLNDLKIWFALVLGTNESLAAETMTCRNFIDKTLDEYWAQLWGVSQAELERYYAPFIAEAAQRLQLSQSDLLVELKRHYGGFCFNEYDPVVVYSPSALNQFFAQLTASSEAPRFGNFWTDSIEAPYDLTTWLHQDPSLLSYLTKFTGHQLELSDTTLFPQNNIFAVLLLDPTLYPKLHEQGYLSILKADWELVDFHPNVHGYTVGWPNEDVSSNVNSCVAQLLGTEPNALSALKAELQEALQREDMPALCHKLNKLLHKVTWQQASNQTHLLRTVIGYGLTSTQVEVEENLRNAVNFADLEVFVGQHVYVIDLALPEPGQSVATLIQDTVNTMLRLSHGVGAHTFGLRCTGMVLILNAQHQIVAWHTLEANQADQTGQITPITEEASNPKAL